MTRLKPLCSLRRNQERSCRCGLSLVCAVLVGLTATQAWAQGFGLTGENHQGYNTRPGNGASGSSTSAFGPPPQGFAPGNSIFNSNHAFTPARPSGADVFIRMLNQGMNSGGGGFSGNPYGGSNNRPGTLNNGGSSPFVHRDPPRGVRPGNGFQPGNSVISGGGAFQQGYVEGQIYIVSGQRMRWSGGQFVPEAAAPRLINRPGNGVSTASTALGGDYPLPEGSLSSEPASTSDSNRDYPLPTGRAAASIEAPPRLLPNSLEISVAPAKKKDIDASRKRLLAAMKDSAEELESVLQDLLISTDNLAQVLRENEVPDRDSSQLIRLVQTGKASSAGALARRVGVRASDAIRLQQQVLLASFIDDVVTSAGKGEVLRGKVRDLKKTVARVNTDSRRIRDVNDLTENLLALGEIYEVVNRSTPGKKTERLPIKESVGQIVLNPLLPLHRALSLGNGLLMVGTGNVGEFALSSGVLADVLQYPIALEDVRPLPASKSSIWTDGVVIINPARMGQTVEFELDGKPYELEAGKRRKFELAAESSAVLSFFQDGETKRLKLVPGTFEFSNEEQLSIRRKRYRVEFDNTASPVAFNFLMNDQPETLLSGEARTLRSAYPIRIEFDRGNGKRSKLVAPIGRGEVVSIGLRAEDLLWDVFTAIPATHEADAELRGSGKGDSEESESAVIQSSESSGSSLEISGE